MGPLGYFQKWESPETHPRHHGATEGSHCGSFMLRGLIQRLCGSDFRLWDFMIWVGSNSVWKLCRTVICGKEHESAFDSSSGLGRVSQDRGAFTPSCRFLFVYIGTGPLILGNVWLFLNPVEDVGALIRQNLYLSCTLNDTRVQKTDLSFFPSQGVLAFPRQ